MCRVKLLGQRNAGIMHCFSRYFKRCPAVRVTMILLQHPESKETELEAVQMCCGYACSLYFGLLW